MTYIPDGTEFKLKPPYEARYSLWERIFNSPLPAYASEYEGMPDTVRAFGWLSSEHDFPTGPVEEGIVPLLEYAVHICRVWQMRGFHLSPFYQDPDRPYEQMMVECRFGPKLLGSASLLLVDEEGNPWVGPNLVLHYVRDIHYVLPFKPRIPSKEFVRYVRVRPGWIPADSPDLEEERRPRKRRLSRGLRKKAAENISPFRAEDDRGLYS